MGRFLVTIGMLAASCGSCKQSTSDNQPNIATGELRAVPNSATTPISVAFDWSAPCRVPILESRTKNGQSMRIGYEVALVATDDPFLELRFEKLRVIKMDGVDMKGAGKDALNSASALRMIQATMLPLLVTPEGKPLRLAGDASAEFLRAVEGAEMNVSDDVRSMVQAESVKEIVEAQQIARWGYWVEFWLGEKLSNEKPKLIEANFGAPWKVTLAGQVEGASDLVLLKASFADDKITAREALKPGVPKELEGNPALDAKMKMAGSVVAAIEPEHGRPHRVIYSVQSSHGGKTASETQDWFFDWSKATGCSTRPKQAKAR